MYHNQYSHFTDYHFFASSSKICKIEDSHLLLSSSLRGLWPKDVYKYPIIRTQSGSKAPWVENKDYLQRNVSLTSTLISPETTLDLFVHIILYFWAFLKSLKLLQFYLFYLSEIKNVYFLNVSNLTVGWGLTN